MSITKQQTKTPISQYCSTDDEVRIFSAARMQEIIKSTFLDQAAMRLFDDLVNAGCSAPIMRGDLLQFSLHQILPESVTVKVYYTPIRPRFQAQANGFMPGVRWTTGQSMQRPDMGLDSPSFRNQWPQFGPYGPNPPDFINIPTNVASIFNMSVTADGFVGQQEKTKPQFTDPRVLLENMVMGLVSKMLGTALPGTFASLSTLLGVRAIRLFKDTGTSDSAIAVSGYLVKFGENIVGDCFQLHFLGDSFMEEPLKSYSCQELYLACEHIVNFLIVGPKFKGNTM